MQGTLRTMLVCAVLLSAACFSRFDRPLGRLSAPEPGRGYVFGRFAYEYRSTFSTARLILGGGRTQIMMGVALESVDTGDRWVLRLMTPSPRVYQREVYANAVPPGRYRVLGFLRIHQAGYDTTQSTTEVLPLPADAARLAQPFVVAPGAVLYIGDYAFKTAVENKLAGATVTSGPPRSVDDHAETIPLFHSLHPGLKALRKQCAFDGASPAAPQPPAPPPARAP